jgi:gamma-glutamylcyclotransferase (GGCT)/AIG2-like uncharacterized protein YtfP
VERVTGWRAPFTDADYPELPYPGRAPGASYVHLDGATRGIGLPLRPEPSAFAGWRVGASGPDSGPGSGQDLDDWLAEHDVPPLAARVPVLCYGANRCPSKITWLRRRLGLTGPVVVLASVTEGVSAVWAAGLRARDGERPAVLVAAPGAVERHAVWLATPEQVAVLDRCEGRGSRYRLSRLRTGRVCTEDGALIERPWCYLAAGPARAPLLVDGAPVRCAQLDQRAARELTGVPADSDGLTADEVGGAPHPDEWPDSLFSYGLLRPGRSGWPLVAPHAVGEPRPVLARGTRYDTGLGFPAMLLGPEPGVSGTLTRLRDPGRLLPVLDRYEGAAYRRVRLVLPAPEPDPTDDGTVNLSATDIPAGTVAWAYVWVGDRTGLRPDPPPPSGTSAAVDHTPVGSPSSHDRVTRHGVRRGDRRG